MEFNVSRPNIWTGGADVGTAGMRDPQRGAAFTCATTMRSRRKPRPRPLHVDHGRENSHSARPDVADLVDEQTASTLYGDKVVIQAQWKNMRRYPGAPQVDIHVDVGRNRARRVIERLVKQGARPVQEPVVLS